MAAGLTITGTDTEVGKTYFTRLLVTSLRGLGVDAVGFKPVCCGERSDAELLVAASGETEPVEAVNPLWYRAPVAPAVAAELEDRPVSLGELQRHAEALAARHEVVVMEGVGGWEVPLTREENFGHLAEALGWPVVLVAANRLGALNHTLLTEAAVRQRGLPLAAVVLNHLEEERDVAMVTNRSVLERRLAEVPLVELMCEQDWLEEEFVELLRVAAF